MPLTPAPIVTVPVVQIVVNGRTAAGGGNAEPCGNVFYYEMTTPAGVLIKANVSTIFQTTVLVPLLAAANARYTPNTITIRDIANAQDPLTSFAAAGAGAIATDGEPSLDAVVARLLTGFRGKNLRGFKHFGGTSEVDTTMDILTGAGLARWQAVAAACLVTMVDAGGVSWAPFVFSPYKSQVKVNPTTVRGAIITSVVLDKDIRSMRKRKTRPAVV